MLSFHKSDNSRIIAVVKGGKQDGLKVYISDKKVKEEKLSEKDMIVFEELYELYEAGELDEEQEKVFKSLKRNMKNNTSRLFIDDDSEFRLVPINKDQQRDVLYISGASNSGKSYFASQYTKLFRKIFPSKPIYIFSCLSEDPAFDSIPNITRVLINDEIVSNPIELKELSNSLVIFDDCDDLEGKQKKAIITLQKALLQLARKQRTYVISTNHLTTDYSRTRHLLNEANYIVCFPNSGGKAGLERMFSYYLGIKKKQAEQILTTDSRWLVIHKSAPNFVMTEHEIYLIK